MSAARGQTSVVWARILEAFEQFPAGASGPQLFAALPDLQRKSISRILKQMTDLGVLFKGSPLRGTPWFRTEAAALAWAHGRQAQSAARRADERRRASGSVKTKTPTAAERAQMPAVIPPGLEVERGPSYQHDPRYQCGPDDPVPPVFSRTAVGIDPISLEAWGGTSNAN